MEFETLFQHYYLSRKGLFMTPLIVGSILCLIWDKIISYHILLNDFLGCT